MMQKQQARHEHLHRRTLLWAMRGCLAVLILLSPVVTSMASSYPGEVGQVPPTEQTALVMAPLASPDQLFSASQRMQQAGFVIYEHLGGQTGEYLLAGIELGGDEALPDIGGPLQVLDLDIAQGSYYLVVVPPGRPQPVWSNLGTLLFDGGDHVLLRATARQADQLAQQGAELSLLSFRPLVLPAASSHASTAPETLDPDPRVQTILNQVTSTILQNYESQLSGEVATTIGGASYTIATRNTRSGTPIQKATQFAYEHLVADGYNVQYHTWTLSGDTNRNVVAEKPGLTQPGNIFIIGAHLDDMPTGATAPGADDNASGSTAVLLAADILSQYQWNYTLRFVLWTGEEQGLKGSTVYASQAHSANENILGYLNLDMIAFNGSAPPEVNLFWKSTVPASEAIANLFADVVTAYGLNLVPFKYNAVTYTIGNQSDNKPFWDQGYPSILAIEDYYGDFTPYYHTVNDRMSTLNMAYFTDFTKAAIGTFVHMAGGPMSEPTAVSLASFEAAPASGGVQLSWETVSEIDNTGFNVYRSLTAEQPDGLLAFVPSQAPGSTQGASYTLFDSNVVEGQTYWYWLEDVSIDGSTTLHGPISVQYVAPTAVTVTEMAAGDAVVDPGPWSYPVIAAGLAGGIVLWSLSRKSQRKRKFG